MLSLYTRRDFPSLGLYRSYLNTALVGLMPRVLREEGVRSLIEYVSDPVGKTLDAAMKYEYLRKGLARLFGADPGEITIAGSTTSCIARIAASIIVSRAREGERTWIAATIHEYPGVVQAVRSICRSLSPACEGFSLVGSPGREQWEDDAELFLEEHPGAVLIASGVSWVAGYHADLARVAVRARKTGGYLIADVAQHVGNVVFNAHETGVDAACGTTKKWLLNPLSGMGVTYVSRRLIREVDPYLYNLHNLQFSTDDYCSGDDRLLGNLPFKEDADKFSTISRPSTFSLDVAGMVIDYILALSQEAINDHVIALRRVAEDLLEQEGIAYSLSGVPYSRRSGIILAMPGLRPARLLEICKSLQKRGVAVSCRSQAGFTGIRISVHIYNEARDVEVFVEDLHKMLG